MRTCPLRATCTLLHGGAADGTPMRGLVPHCPTLHCQTIDTIVNLMTLHTSICTCAVRHCGAASADDTKFFRLMTEYWCAACCAELRIRSNH